MRIVVIGAEGTIGRAVTAELSGRHQIVKVGRSSGDLSADLTKRADIEAMFTALGTVDAVVATTGHVHFGPLSQMSSEQFRLGLDDKLMGQVDLVLIGQRHVADGGSFTLTSGILNHDPIRAGTAAACANAALEGFVKGAAIDLGRGLRINVVSPGLLEESAAKYGAFFPGHIPVAGAKVAKAYAKCIEGGLTGQVVLVH